jgi:TPR repeat protein
VDWYFKAANNGNADAINEIGFMYQYGANVSRNVNTAIEWYTKTVNQGNAHAQYYLGCVYKNENQVKDLQLAVNWFQKAADNDYYGAKYILK